MRLLLDAHVSGRVIAKALREVGHDVLALSDEPSLEGMDDAEVLELAAQEGRILVTHDVKDFPPLLRSWAEAGRSHAGCILVHGIGHHEYGRLLDGLERLFRRRPHQEDWQEVAVVLSPSAP